MRNLRYIVRLTVAFLARYKALMLIGIIMGVIFFLVITTLLPRVLAGSTTKIGIAGRYTVNTLPLNIQTMIGEGLTSVNADGLVVPKLAESWSTPDNGKTWIFKLKPGLTWQDGKNLVSGDLSYQFSDAEIAYPDDSTIIFTLQSPYSAFPAVVAKPAFRKGLLGTGEWRVENLSLVSDFVDKLTLENGQKERLIYRFYPTEERVKLAFQLGQIDLIKDLLDPKPLDTWQRLTTKKEANKGEYVAVFFNTGDKFLGDKTLRQALSYATQKDNLAGERALGPISESSWVFNPQVKPYNYDPAKAKSMISAMPADVKNNLEITLTTSSLLLSQAELIKKDWEAVGVKVNLQVMSEVPQNYQALLAIFDMPEDPDQYTLWHSTQTQTNITKYSNPRIDKLLEDGRTTTDPATRKQIYLDFQRFLLEDSPALFLYYPSIYSFER
jgi:peptide/nickel transport system substrate-binding protein